jgi:hypothetical protein
MNNVRIMHVAAVLAALLTVLGVLTITMLDATVIGAGVLLLGTLTGVLGVQAARRHRRERP